MCGASRRRRCCAGTPTRPRSCASRCACSSGRARAASGPGPRPGGGPRWTRRRAGWRRRPRPSRARGEGHARLEHLAHAQGVTAAESLAPCGTWTAPSRSSLNTAPSERGLPRCPRPPRIHYGSRPVAGCRCHRWRRPARLRPEPHPTHPAAGRFATRCGPWRRAAPNLQRRPLAVSAFASLAVGPRMS